VLSDLAALTPPLLVCAAFLIAVAAFLRHEMRGARKSSGEERSRVPGGGENPAGPGPQPGAGQRSGARRTDAL